MDFSVAINCRLPLLVSSASFLSRSRGSSGSIASDYALDNRAIEVRSPAEAKEFFLQPLCPDRLWSPHSLLYNEYRRSFPRGNSRPGRDANHSLPSSAEVKNE
jgi:hypothetical protein